MSEVHKRYGHGRDSDEALRGVSLSVETGEVCAVVGPNGAGKTTLFGTVLGFLWPTGGEVLIEGKDARDWIRRNGAGWMPERFAPPGVWRVREMLVAFARMEGARRDAAARADHTIERFALDAYAHRRVNTLSRGVTQRLGLAQALLGPRRLVVLDEPTSGLDPDGRDRFRDALEQLRGDDVTVLLASHDLSEVERLADRVVLLENGIVHDIMAARHDAVPARYRIRVIAPEPVVLAAFPDGHVAPAASHTGPGEGAPTNGIDYVVNVASPDDLNARLRTVLERGGLLLEVNPVTEPLATRVARSLGTSSTRSDRTEP